MPADAKARVTLRTTFGNTIEVDNLSEQDVTDIARVIADILRRDEVPAPSQPEPPDEATT